VAALDRRGTGGEAVRAALLVLILAAPVSAQTDERLTHAAIAGYMVAAQIDIAGTSYCLGKGTCREANPLFKPLVESRGVVPAMAVKAATHTAIAGLLLTKHKKHPRAVFWFAVALMSAQIAVDVHNYRTGALR
jgi:hypothetical protein